MRDSITVRFSASSEVGDRFVDTLNQTGDRVSFPFPRKVPGRNYSKEETTCYETVRKCDIWE